LVQPAGGKSRAVELNLFGLAVLDDETNATVDQEPTDVSEGHRCLLGGSRLKCAMSGASD
jgi:hypothetical protein